MEIFNRGWLIFCLDVSGKEFYVESLLEEVLGNLGDVGKVKGIRNIEVFGD